MKAISDFLAEIDRRWILVEPQTVRLHLIGTAALMLQADYLRGTKDSDVFETIELTAAIQQELVRIAGPRSEVYTRHRLYVDIVANGIPFLPQRPTWHAVPLLNQALKRLEVSVLDIVDVVVSKLKRFSQSDVSDIGEMVDRDLVPHDSLVTRFREAVDFLADARADDLRRYVANLHRVERDQFGLEPTEIELPGWI